MIFLKWYGGQLTLPTPIRKRELLLQSTFKQVNGNTETWTTFVNMNDSDKCFIVPIKETLGKDNVSLNF